jgi:uncharacterized protein (TIGR03083 family)
MVVPATPPVPLADLLRVERRRLLELLDGLDTADWARGTPCPGWTVADVVRHLVGDDLVAVAWHRDGHRPAPSEDGLDESAFVAWLDALQVEWVRAARRISPALAVELLRWLDAPVATVLARLETPGTTAVVHWASDRPVPGWLDVARELTERWIHRQQLREALGRPSDLDPDLAGPVLDSLRWAYPYRLGALRRPEGTTVSVEVSGPDVVRSWTLVSDGASWSFDGPVSGPGTASATLVLSDEQAWRLLTNNFDPARHGEPAMSGDAAAGRVLRRTRAIIGEPHERGALPSA